MEACDLFDGLLRNTESELFTKRQGWKYPMSREAIILADLIDLTVSLNTDPKKAGQQKLYDRPWVRASHSEEGKKVLKGSAVELSEALEMYQFPKQSKSAEEIHATNRKFLAAQRKKED